MPQGATDWYGVLRNAATLGPGSWWHKGSVPVSSIYTVKTCPKSTEGGELLVGLGPRIYAVWMVWAQIWRHRRRFGGFAP